MNVFIEGGFAGSGNIWGVSGNFYFASGNIYDISGNFYLAAGYFRKILKNYVLEYILIENQKNKKYGSQKYSENVKHLPNSIFLPTVVRFVRSGLPFPEAFAKIA